MCADKIQISICASTWGGTGKDELPQGLEGEMAMFIVTRSQNKCSYLVAQMFTVRCQQQIITKKEIHNKKTMKSQQKKHDRQKVSIKKNGELLRSG